MDSTAPSRRPNARPSARRVREHVARLLVIVAGMLLAYGVASEMTSAGAPPVDPLPHVLDAGPARSSDESPAGQARTEDGELATAQVVVVLAAAAGALALTWRAMRPSARRD